MLECEMSCPENANSVGHITWVEKGEAPRDAYACRKCLKLQLQILADNLGKVESIHVEMKEGR